MRAKIIITALLGVFLIAVVYVLYLNKESNNDDTEQKKAGEIKKTDTDMSIDTNSAIDLDQVAEHPEKYKGPISVSGTVVQVDDSKNLFVLGCEDACVLMPVEYKGKMPQIDKEIIARGEIKTAENGKYIFEAGYIKLK